VLACDQARVVAVQQTAVFTAEQRLVIQQQRVQAQTVLIKQAQLSFQARHFGFSVSIFESAVRMAPPPAPGVVVAGVDPWRELAQARVEAARQAQLAQAQLAAAQETALRQQREQQLAAARAQLDAQQQRAAEQRQAQLKRDQLAYNKALAEGQQLLSNGNFDGAGSAFLVAKQLHHTAAVDSLLALTAERRTLATAKTDTERQLLEAKLDAERTRRIAAEKEATQNQERYKEALQLAQAALKQRDYTVAQAKFNEAGAVFKTDVVLTGLKKVAEARAQEETALKAKQADDNKAARVKALIADGQTALKDKKYAAAVQTFHEARKLAPDHVDVVAGLSQAEHGRDEQFAAERKKADEAHRLDGFQRLLKSGQANLAAKHYDAAAANFTEALKLSPGDATATAALKQAEQARVGSATDAKTQAEAKQKQAAYQKHLADGRLALTGKRYDDAIKSFSAAQKVLPGDHASQDFLAEAQKAKKDAADALTAAAQKRTDEQTKQASYQAALLAGQKAHAARNYGEAIKSFTEAARLMPDDAKAAKLLKQAQQAQTDAAKQPDVDTARQKQEQQKKTQFAALLKDAGAKLAGKHYAEAKSTYQEALKLYPNDTGAQKGLKEALHALEEPKGKSPPPPVKDAKALYQKAMQDGALAEKQQKYADAVKSYQEALQHTPKDTQATAALQRAQLHMHLTEAQRFLDVGRFVDAQREAEAALKLAPGDLAAKKLLDKAKQMKK
jgi:tetratricopeptide (TPR) repeat protein